MRSVYPAPYNPEPKNPTWLLPVIIALLALIFLFWKSARAEEINLSIIAQIESSNNPNAYNPKSGARGMYQITPICLKDYNIQNRANLGVNDLFSQSTCYTVAKWYIVARIPQLLQNRGIVETIDTVLWAYNAGIGNVVKGKMPKETRQYIAKYHKLQKGK